MTIKQPGLRPLACALACVLALAAGCSATGPAAPAVSATPATQDCAPIDQARVLALFEKWNASLKGGVAAEVVAHYLPGSILLPTASKEVRQTPASQEAYFRKFIADYSPYGTLNTFKIDYACNMVANTGLYTFTYRKQNNREVPARYTYVYQWVPRLGKWMIVSHHSSAMPLE